MALIDIKRAVTGNRQANFTHFVDGQMWYTTEYSESFPVPIADLAGATLHRNEKALLLMRYMRKWNVELSKADA